MKQLVFLFAMVTLLVSGISAKAQLKIQPMPPHYSMRVITQAYPQAAATSINDLGQVAGIIYYDGVHNNNRVFTWDSTIGIKNLGSPFSQWDLRMVRVNNSGLIAGIGFAFYRNYQPVYQYFTSKAKGGFQTVDEAYTLDCSLNNLGQLVGDSPSGSFIFQNGKKQPLEGLDPRFSAEAINDLGQVTGIGASGPVHHTSYLYIWQKDQPLRTTLIPGTSYGILINNRTQIVGTSGLFGVLYQHIFFWDPVTGYQDMGAIRPGSDEVATPYGINDRGEVVGTVRYNSNYSPSYREHRPFLWKYGKMWDLNDLVSLPPHWEITQAYSINKHGQIAIAVLNWAENRGFGAILDPDFGPIIALPGEPN